MLVFISQIIVVEHQELPETCSSRIQVGDTLSVIGLAAEDAAGKRIRVRDTDEVIVVNESQMRK